MLGDGTAGKAGALTAKEMRSNEIAAAELKTRRSLVVLLSGYISGEMATAECQNVLNIRIVGDDVLRR